MKNKPICLIFVSVLFLFWISTTGTAQVIWDGGGATNNWSDAQNWSTDSVPTAGANVAFNTTSTKNCVIDVNITTGTFLIASGYTGIISQSGTSTIQHNAGFTQQDGAFIGGSGFHRFNGSRTFTAGNFTATTGQTIFRVSGTAGSTTLTVDSGWVFNPNGGTILIEGPGSGGTSVNVGGTATELSLHNLTINSDANTVGLNMGTGGRTWVIGGTLNLENGVINGNATNNVRTENPVIIESTFDGGSTFLELTGNATRTITVPGGAGMPNLVVDAPNTTINTSGTGTSALRVLDLQNAEAFTNGQVNFTFSGAVTIDGDFNQGAGSLTFNGSFTQTGGIFSGGTGLIDFNGGRTFTGGTFTATSGEMSFTASGTSGSTSIVIDAGWNFVPNGGTFVVDGPGSGATSLTVSGTATELTLHNLKIESSNNAIGLNLGTTGNRTWIVQGQLQLVNGIITGNATRFVRAQGNVIISDTFDGGNVPLTFGGNANQTYSNAGGTNPTGTVTIDKSGGKLLLLNDMLLGTAQVFNLTSGEFDQGTSGSFRSGNITIGTNGIWRNNGIGAVTLGGSVTNSGLIDFDGTTAACGEGDAVLVRSSTAGTQRAWSGTGFFLFQDVNVQDQTGTAAITVFGGTNNGNNGANWTFDGTNCLPILWDGGGATNNYSEPQNWRRKILPLPFDVVTFSNLSVKNVLIDDDISVDGFAVTSGYTGTITLDSGNTLELGSFGLSQANGTILTCSSGNCTLSCNGPIALSGGTFLMNGLGGRIDFDGNLTITGGSLSGTGQLEISRNISGSFFNNGTTIFDGSTDSIVTITTNLNIGDTIVNKTNLSGLSISAGQRLIARDLTLTDGRLNSGILRSTGTVIVEQTFDGGNFGTLEIIGAISPRNVFLNGGADFPAAIRIDDTNASVFLSGVSAEITAIFLDAGTFEQGTTALSSATIDISGGTFNAGTASMQVMDRISVTSGGSFNGSTGSLLTDGRLEIGGNAVFNAPAQINLGTNLGSSQPCEFLNLNGTFNANGGSIRDFGCLYVINGTVFNNYELNTVNVNDFSDFQSGEITIAGNLSLSRGNAIAVTYNAQGNVSTDTDWDVSNTGLADLKFSGNANQSVTVNTTTREFLPIGKVTVNKTGGTVLLASNFDIRGSAAGFPLELTNGTITTGNFTVNLDRRPLTRTNGYIIGNLRRTFDPTLLPESVRFDVGTTNGYAPVTIEVSTINGANPAFTVGSRTGTLSGANLNESLTMHWSIEPEDILQANLIVNYNDADIPGTASENAFVFLRRNGSETTNQGITSLDTANNVAILNNVTQFSEWSLGTLAPTSATVSVSGRVLNANGQGIFGALIAVTDENGFTRTTITSSFGYYRIEGLNSGNTYIFSPRHKVYQFNPVVVTINEELTDLNFIGEQTNLQKY